MSEGSETATTTHTSAAEKPAEAKKDESTSLSEKPAEKSAIESIEDLVTRTIAEAARASLAEKFASLKVDLVKKEKETLEQIRADQEKVDRDMARFNQMQEEVAKRASACRATIVRLNVGGQTFAAAKETFTAAEGSFFATLLGSDMWVKNDQGEYFIDRDPSLFPIIMTFLRTGRWYTNSLSADDIDRLELELDFYSIKLPRNWIRLDTFKASSSMTLMNNDAEAQGSGSILGVDFLPSHAVWDVTIVQKTGNNWSAIGIAGAATDVSSLCCDTSYGCGLYIDQNNCYFRQKGNNVEELNAIIGTAVAGKVIRVTYHRDDSRQTIQFQVIGNERGTQAYSVLLPDRKVYMALSPSSDCTMSAAAVEGL